MTGNQFQGAIYQAHAFAIVNAHLLEGIHKGLRYQTRDHDAFEAVVLTADPAGVIKIKLRVLLRPVERGHEFALLPLLKRAKKGSMADVDTGMAIITAADPNTPLSVENAQLVNQRHVAGQGFDGALDIGHPFSTLEPSGLDMLSQGKERLTALAKDPFRPFGHHIGASRCPRFCCTDLLLVLAGQQPAEQRHHHAQRYQEEGYGATLQTSIPG